jgi:pyroglutamyl-peptidase
MKKLLITGFEPFCGEGINPSWEAVQRLPDEIAGYSLTKLLVPVVFGKAAECVINVADKLMPDVIISVGQAGGRKYITPETVAINLRFAKIPDNEGNLPKDEPIVTGGENAYFSTLPARKMAEAINSCDIPSEVSYSAGAYVCNDLLYTLLDRYSADGVGVGFIHVPYSREQGKEPCMELCDIVKALTVAIESIE